MHALLELLCLAMTAVHLLGKWWWMGVRYMSTHRITIIKAVCVVVMVLEALIVVGRQRAHVRITRMFRPLFLIDCYFAHNVRRWERFVDSDSVL